MKDLKFEILLFYYKRPEIVKNALESIRKVSEMYDNWHLSFIDDSGDEEFRNSLESFELDQSKVSYIPINMSDDEKNRLGGSMMGAFANEIIERTDADVIIPLCDDDALMADYLNNLNTFYLNNPQEVWSYCHVIFYDPNSEHYLEATFDPKYKRSTEPNLNAHTEPIHPSCKVDSSQVTFRKTPATSQSIRYPSPQTIDLDRSLFESFVVRHGLCPFNSALGQYKGWFPDQLGARVRSTGKEYIQ